LLDLRRVHDLQPCMIEKIEISAFRQSIEVSDRPRVENRFDAIMSHQFAAAVALAQGWVGLDSLEPSMRTDSVVQELISKVHVRHEPEFDTLYPIRWSHKVCVYLTNGSRFEAESRTPPGGEDAPIGNAELVNKFVSLAEPVLGELGVKLLQNAVEGLSEIEDVASLAPLLGGHSTI
jgi:2-methylcitrate dehydratase PrpD